MNKSMYDSWFLVFNLTRILIELLEKKIPFCMHVFVIERQMKRYCNKTEVLKQCEIDSGLCMNIIHPVEFVVKA